MSFDVRRTGFSSTEADFILGCNSGDCRYASSEGVLNRSTYWPGRADDTAALHTVVDLFHFSLALLAWSAGADFRTSGFITEAFVDDFMFIQDLSPTNFHTAHFACIHLNDYCRLDLTSQNPRPFRMRVRYASGTLERYLFCCPTFIWADLILRCEELLGNREAPPIKTCEHFAFERFGTTTQSSFLHPR